MSEEVTKKSSFKRGLIKWTLIVLVAAAALFFVYRWSGTNDYVGVVQRVYESQSDYRIEFAEDSGEVLVVGNNDIKFPYMKLDSADLHAELHRLAESGDTVRLSIWGFRQSWLSTFPNVLDVELLSTQKERISARAVQLNNAIEEMMRRKGVLPKQDGFKEDLQRTLEDTLAQPAPPAAHHR